MIEKNEVLKKLKTLCMVYLITPKTKFLNKQDIRTETEVREDVATTLKLMEEDINKLPVYDDTELLKELLSHLQCIDLEDDKIARKYNYHLIDKLKERLDINE